MRFFQTKKEIFSEKKSIYPEEISWLACITLLDKLNFSHGLQELPSLLP